MYYDLGKVDISYYKQYLDKVATANIIIIFSQVGHHALIRKNRKGGAVFCAIEPRDV